MKISSIENIQSRQNKFKLQYKIFNKKSELELIFIISFYWRIQIIYQFENSSIKIDEGKEINNVSIQR